MPSVVPGYQYDIFISYRQKDNKGDRWVSNFVDALRIELEATLKDDVSIYFDENPHDGLLETHDVSASLNQKLKCLIFIPIISQTYCDPKSFAWEHEFIAFKNQASGDDLGLKISLLNGNITSRILPIRIHELDTDDVKVLEQELGYLRPIDFIYKGPGVNRPLKSNEHNPNDNANKSHYRDQINKVANAVKELIAGAKAPSGSRAHRLAKADDRLSGKKSFAFSSKAIILSALLLVAALAVTVYFLRGDRLPSKKIGIAILPFRDISASKENDVYGAGMASEIRTTLSESKHFDFITSMQATMPFVNTNLSPKDIGKQLRVDYLLSGFYQVSGKTIKVDVELVDALGNVIWNFSVQNELTDIFKTQENISDQVLNKFSAARTAGSLGAVNENLDAYVHYQKGNAILINVTSYDSASITPAIEQFQRAIAIDSLYTDAWVGLVAGESRLVDRNPLDKVLKATTKDHVDYVNENLIDSWRTDLINSYYYYYCQEDLSRGLKLAMSVLEKNPENSAAIEIAGSINRRNLNHKEAIYYAEKGLDLEPTSIVAWDQLASSLQAMGDYENCLRAHIKKWQLGANNNSDIYWEAGALGSLDAIPRELIQKADSDFLLAQYKLERKYRDVLNISRGFDDYLVRADAYMIAGLKDSSYYWGKQQVEMLLREGVKNDFAYATAYAYAGNKEKALEHLNNITWFKHPGIWHTVIKRHFTIFILIATGDYEEGTQKLLALNKEYPAFGDYGQFRNDAYYDVVKSKYPPFAEAVKNLRSPPSIALRKPIVLSGDARISKN